MDLVSIGTSEQIKGYTGADLAALVREASVLALKEFMLAGDSSKPLQVSSRHFVAAADKIRPSVPEKVSFFPSLLIQCNYKVSLGSKTLREAAAYVYGSARTGRGRGNGVFLSLSQFNYSKFQFESIFLRFILMSVKLYSF